MNGVILNGATASDAEAKLADEILTDELTALGWRVTSFQLRDMKIAYCAGCFECWVKTPGVCIIDDDGRKIAQAIVQSDLTVFLTPVTFGGYSSILKKASDRFIGLLSPSFAKVNGEIHHKKRYDRYPRLLGVGLLDHPDEPSTRLFRTLVHRNAINMYSPADAGGVILRTQEETDMRQNLQAMLAQVGAAMSAKRALLLIGSPRGKKSASQKLGLYLLAQLQARGCETEHLRVYSVVRSAKKQADLIAAVTRADVLIVSAPLYVDTLPAAVIETLEIIAQHRDAVTSRRRQFLAISNCGFPEAQHNEPAIAGYRLFAQQLGFDWAGGLMLGGGAAIGDRSLEQLGRMGQTVRRSLDLTAEALAQSQPAPPEAIQLMAQPMMPRWIYLLFAEIGWRVSARKYGVLGKLRARPYA